jgi:hypothetical protein
MARGIHPHAFVIDALKTLFIGKCKALLRRSMCLPDLEVGNRENLMVLAAC